jgi:hypothetical protein
VAARRSPAALAINVDALVVAVDEPAELDAVGDPLLHFGFGIFETVRRREYFNHEFGHKAEKLPALLFGEAGQGLVGNPRGIG